jgi:3-dehydroquinate synthase
MPSIKSTSYNIQIEQGSFNALNKFLSKKEYSKYIIICDENTSEKCLSNLLFACETLTAAEIIELESGEKNKTIETCMQVWGALTDIGADKKSLIINLGGGAISDLGGFVASTYKRGIDFINIPTTLLSMVDASVGGKTGVDFEGIKNHIGVIYEPKGVFVNPIFLETLSERQIKNGYAEIIKIALIADFGFWKALKKIKNYKEFYTENIISKAIELKNIIVKKDLYETNLRKSLNFGHNVGHALESALIKQNKDILHGEAVAFGMIIESEIANQLKRISKKELDTIVTYIKSIYKEIKLSNSTKKLVLEFLKHDKKNDGTNLCFALPNNIGSYKLSCDVTLEIVEKIISK